MRSINVAELKNQLSKYLALAKGGEEIVIDDRNLPVAKLVPFCAKEANEEELLLVAAGKMRLPKETLDVKELFKIRTGKVKGNEAVRALLEDRSESLMRKVTRVLGCKRLSLYASTKMTRPTASSQTNRLISREIRATRIIRGHQGDLEWLREITKNRTSPLALADRFLGKPRFWPPGGTHRSAVSSPGRSSP